MKKSVKKQTRDASFLAVAQKLGDMLADIVAHPNTPSDVIDAIQELDCRIHNHFSSDDISLRYSFAHRLVGMLEKKRA